MANLVINYLRSDYQLSEQVSSTNRVTYEAKTCVDVEILFCLLVVLQVTKSSNYLHDYVPILTLARFIGLKGCCSSIICNLGNYTNGWSNSTIDV